jgi:SAM-dependent methyltransferase
VTTEYGPETYGDRISEVYDEWYPGSTNAEEAASFLATLAGSGPALELGIGTGRVALPLISRGVPVHGIDASGAMVERLREKPGGKEIPVTIGDFADVDIEGRFSLVYVVANTFFALLSQEDQLRCFENVARRLDNSGVFVIEAFVPDPTRFTGGQATRTGRIETDGVVLECSRHDPVTQRVDSQTVVIRDGETKLYPVNLRYAWPPELDLMARLAGLRLRKRHGDWSGEPFTAASGSHVSVYEHFRE